MVITWNGNNYFKLQSGDLVVLVDPDNQRSFKGAAVALHTLRPARTERPPEDSGEASLFWVDHQGEYEANGVRVHGYHTEGDGKVEKTAYRLTFDDLAVGVLGHLTKDLDPKVQGELAGVDILIVPAGGSPYLSPAAVAKIVRQIEPSAIIPGLGENTKPLLKELGQANAAPSDRYTVKKKDLTPKAMVVQVLTV